MEPQFKIGDSVMVSKASWWLRLAREITVYKPWREATVTATGEGLVRVRTVTRLPFGKVRWINRNDPDLKVSLITD